MPAGYGEKNYGGAIETYLCPSKRYARRIACRHKTPVDWARQMVLQFRRWLPEREIIVVGDNAPLRYPERACNRRCAGQKSWLLTAR